jgi:hypothetical protein
VKEVGWGGMLGAGVCFQTSARTSVKSQDSQGLTFLECLMCLAGSTYARLAMHALAEAHAQCRA